MMLLFVLLITLSIMCCKLCNCREPQLVSWEDGGRKLCKYAHYEFVPKRKLCAGKHEPLNHPEKQHSRVQPLDATATWLQILIMTWLITREAVELVCSFRQTTGKMLFRGTRKLPGSYLIRNITAVGVITEN